MKKFSNISNVKVGEEPKIAEASKQEIELAEFKSEVMKLMEDLLSIRSYGVARPEIMMPTRIVGKEMFIEALSDLLTNKSNKDQVKTLESLKSTNRDWKSIEDRILSIQDLSLDVKESKKINDIIKKYGSSEDDLNFFLELHTKKISKEIAYNKHLLVEKMLKKSSNPLLKTISNKYLEASK